MDDLQSRLIAPCAQFNPQDLQAIPDIPAVLRRLLLFETYIFQTIRFKEFLPFVRTLGVDNVLCLLNCGALKLELDVAQSFQSGQTKDFPAIREKAPLPQMSFAFSLLRGAQFDEYLYRNIQTLHSQLYGYVSLSDSIKLEEAVLRALLARPSDSGFFAMNGQVMDLRANSPVLKKAVLMKLLSERNLTVAESDLNFRIVPIDESDFRAESNLVDKLGLNLDEAHRIVEQALLAVGNLNSRIEDMKNYTALSGFIDGELSLFAGKYDFLSATLSPDAREKTFDRVVKIRRLPTWDLKPPDQSFDMERFIEIRASKECVEFRSWLRQMQSATEEEIAEQINTTRVKLARFVHGSLGKSVRLAIAIGAGLLPPPVGLVAGGGISAVDTFLMEKIFPMSGPSLFLSRTYRSLFKDEGWS